jgi:hypothetical protein
MDDDDDDDDDGLGRDGPTSQMHRRLLDNALLLARSPLLSFAKYVPGDTISANDRVVPGAFTSCL